MKKITIKWGPLTDGVYESFPGMLFDDNYAMRVDRSHGCQLWIDRVVPGDDPGVYVTDLSVSGIVLAECIANRADEDLMVDVYRKLRGMDGFEMVTCVLMPNGVDIEMFPPDESEEDET